MLVRIVGCAYIVMAGFILVKPELVRDWIKNNRKNKSMFLLPLLFGIAMVWIGLLFQGIWANIILVLGCMGIIKGILFLNPKTYERMMDWALKFPLVYYRIGGCVHVLIGIIILNLN